MTRKQKIRKLVEFATKDKSTSNQIVLIGELTDTDVTLLKAKTGFNLAGYSRIIDKSAVKHTLDFHGNPKTENARGQIAVVAEDFELIPEILKSKNVIFSGKNKLGRDCLLYEAHIGNTYYYVEEIRTGRKHLALQTLYKRK